MQIPRFSFPVISMACMLALSGGVHAQDITQHNLQSETDTFGRLLQKQAQLLDAEMDNKIRNSQNQAAGVASAGVNPLASVKQEVSAQEPVVEAIWGIKGKEVAEVSYKGRRVPVSMQEPFISKVDGWKLESIQQYMINLVQLDDRGRVARRKTIMLDFLGGEGSQSRINPASANSNPSSPPISPITPGITVPAMR
ncbi:hypothetical protein K5D42_25150 [Pseudomonas cichorii]|nr:hypothetical protein [Pseudomonas cichorii]MBX8493161.1 hypothetical protein [Pseudomonas cichorii]